MVGFKLTPDILKSIMEPLKHSYTNMKLINDIITTKSSGVLAENMGYDARIYEILFEYMGVNTSAVEYLDRMKDVEEIENFHGFGFSVELTTNTVTPVIIIPNVPYEYYAVPDNMRELGKMYARLENEFSEVFTKHIPTDSELILSSLT